MRSFNIWLLVQTFGDIKCLQYLGGMSSSNELFMADIFGSCVNVLDTTNGSIRTIRDRDLGRPMGICLFGDSLYVTDIDNNCIHVFNIDGRYIKCIGEGQINHPVDVCVSPDGELFVSDNDMFHIRVFRIEDGSYVRSIVLGLAFSEITLSPNGEFIFVSTYTNGIKMLRAADGTLVRSFVDSSSGMMRVSPDGQELFVLYNVDQIKVFQL